MYYDSEDDGQCSLWRGVGFGPVKGGGYLLCSVVSSLSCPSSPSFSSPHLCSPTSMLSIRNSMWILSKNQKSVLIWETSGIFFF